MGRRGAQVAMPKRPKRRDEALQWPRIANGAGALLLAATIALAGCGQSQSPRSQALRHAVVPRPRTAFNPTGLILGAIPTRGRLLPHAAGTAGGNTPLVYHGGPVMHSVTSYAIFWKPSGYSFPPGLESLVDRYFAAISTASRSASDIYSVARQYYDPSGPIANELSFGGAIDSRDPLPASTCSDPAVPGPCLSDQALQGEVEHIVSSRGLPHGLADMYFLFTPNGISSCDSSGCFVSDYCAYHTTTSRDPANAIIWAFTPFSPKCVYFEEEPNGNPADRGVLTGVSHEGIEAMTDPLGSGWYGSGGGVDEIGDKCYRQRGPILGGSLGAQYYQVIAGLKVDVQPEWSNETGSCVMSLSHAPPFPSFTVSGRPAPGRPVTFNASRSTPQDGVPITSYTWSFGASGLSVTHILSLPAQSQVTLTVTDARGARNSYTASVAPLF